MIPQICRKLQSIPQKLNFTKYQKVKLFISWPSHHHRRRLGPVKIMPFIKVADDYATRDQIISDYQSAGLFIKVIHNRPFNNEVLKLKLIRSIILPQLLQTNDILIH